MQNWTLFAKQSRKILFSMICMSYFTFENLWGWKGICVLNLELSNYRFTIIKLIFLTYLSNYRLSNRWMKKNIDLFFLSNNKFKLSIYQWSSQEKLSSAHLCCLTHPGFGVLNQPERWTTYETQPSSNSAPISWCVCRSKMHLEISWRICITAYLFKDRLMW